MSEWHTACNKRIKEMGGNAQCCYCIPHEGCEIKAEKPILGGKVTDERNGFKRASQDV